MQALKKLVTNTAVSQQRHQRHLRNIRGTRRFFCQQQQNNDEHKQAFNKLKDKIDSNNTDKDIKKNYYQDILNNAKTSFSDKVNKIDLNKINIDNIKSKFASKDANTENNTNNTQQSQQNTQQTTEQKENNNNSEQQQQQEGEQEGEVKQEQKQEIQQETFYDKISKKDDVGSKFMKFSVDAWRKTFPNDDFIAKQKMEKAKEQARKIKEMEEQMKEYTEEELAEFQEKVPEWKKTSLQTVKQQQEKQSLKDKLKDNVKQKFNKTEFAQNLYQSEEYKEYKDFQSEMKQFKEDAKDHLHNSPSNLVQGSLFIYEKASSENQVARSIREMRKHDPEFDLWELEKEAKVVFESAYNSYLGGDLELLEKICGEQALGYFKALVKKREAENCSPKYKQLWTIDKAQFSKAYMPDAILPVFVFDINIQEIYCNICNKTGKIIDGSDDRVMRYAYLFAVRLHMEPDLETVGHKWEIIETQPKEVVKLLV